MKRESDADEAAHLAMGAELAEEYPGHLPLLAARVASLASLSGERRTAQLQVWREIACFSPHLNSPGSWRNPVALPQHD